MEEQLRAQQLQQQAPGPVMDGDVHAALERLQRVEQQQREQIGRCGSSWCGLGEEEREEGERRRRRGRGGVWAGCQ